jgi:hypothetical protein
MSAKDRAIRAEAQTQVGQTRSVPVRGEGIPAHSTAPSGRPRNSIIGSGVPSSTPTSTPPAPPPPPPRQNPATNPTVEGEGSPQPGSPAPVNPPEPTPRPQQQPAPTESDEVQQTQPEQAPESVSTRVDKIIVALDAIKEHAQEVNERLGRQASKLEKLDAVMDGLSTDFERVKKGQGDKITELISSVRGLTSRLDKLEISGPAPASATTSAPMPFDPEQFKRELLTAVQAENNASLAKLEEKLSAARSRDTDRIRPGEPAPVVPDVINTTSGKKSLAARLGERTGEAYGCVRPGVEVLGKVVGETLSSPIHFAAGLGKMLACSNVVDVAIDHNEKLEAEELLLAKEGSKQLIKGVRGGIPLLMGLADGVGAYYAGSVASYDIIGTQVIAVTGAKAGIGAAVAAGLCGWAIGVVGIAVVTALCTSKALGRVERQSQQTLVFNRRMTALEQRLEELKEKPEASQPRAA